MLRLVRWYDIGPLEVGLVALSLIILLGKMLPDTELLWHLVEDTNFFAPLLKHTKLLWLFVIGH